MRTIFTFATTHYALWAEEIAGEVSIPVDVIPAPAAARANCNIALETLPEDASSLEAALGGAGVPFGRFAAPSGVPTATPPSST